MIVEEWQKGVDSTSTSMEKVQAHELWLKSIHEAIRKEIRDDKPKDEEIPQGGFEGLKMT